METDFDEEGWMWRECKDEILKYWREGVAIFKC
jgi:hypothetical protein